MGTQQIVSVHYALLLLPRHDVSPRWLQRVYLPEVCGLYESSRMLVLMSCKRRVKEAR